MTDEINVAALQLEPAGGAKRAEDPSAEHGAGIADVTTARVLVTSARARARTQSSHT